MRKIVAVILAFLALYGVWWLSGKYFSKSIDLTQDGKPQKYSGPSEKLTAGVQGEYGTLIFLAHEKGYFTQNGLDVTIKQYSSGAPALKDLLEKKIDLADAAEFVAVRNSFLEKTTRLLVQLGPQRTYGRSLRGVIMEYQKYLIYEVKKIGVTRKTNGEFFLGNFLTINYMSSNDVVIVDLEPPELIKAINTGQIDAVLIFEPHVFNLKHSLGKNSINWSGQNGRPNYILLFATGDLVRNKPIVSKRFMQSIVQAQEYIESSDKATYKFMKESLNYSDSYIESVLPKFKFYVSLEQPLLLLLEDEARWAIDNKITTGTKIPNYLDFIYFDALSAVKSDSVTIIR